MKKVQKKPLYTEYNLSLMKEKHEYTQVLLNHKKISRKDESNEMLIHGEGWNRMLVRPSEHTFLYHLTLNHVNVIHTQKNIKTKQIKKQNLNTEHKQQQMN